MHGILTNVQDYRCFSHEATCAETLERVVQVVKIEEIQNGKLDVQKCFM
jgi:hypothetical protein